MNGMGDTLDHFDPELLAAYLPAPIWVQYCADLWVEMPRGPG